MMELDFTYIYIIFQSHSVKNLNNLLTLKKHIDISGLSCTQSELGSLALGIKDLALNMPLRLVYRLTHSPVRGALRQVLLLSGAWKSNIQH